MGRVLELPQPSLRRRGDLLTVTPARVLVDPRLSTALPRTLDRLVCQDSSVTGPAAALQTLLRRFFRHRVALSCASNIAQRSTTCRSAGNPQERVRPELDAEIRRIETMRSDLDPDMDRAAMELYRTAQRLLAERAEKVKIREDANGGA